MSFKIFPVPQNKSFVCQAFFFNGLHLLYKKLGVVGGGGGCLPLPKSNIGAAAHKQPLQVHMYDFSAVVVQYNYRKDKNSWVLPSPSALPLHIVTMDETQNEKNG
jgi:hypothetical protein